MPTEKPSSQCERNDVARLKADDVREIRQLAAAGCVQRRLAERFGVSPMVISQIVNRRTWTRLSQPTPTQEISKNLLVNLMRKKCGTSQKGEHNGRAKLSIDDVREIRRLASEGWLQRQIADRFGIAQVTVSGIINRRLWTHID
jgi:IS30 family transposase